MDQAFKEQEAGGLPGFMKASFAPTVSPREIESFLITDPNKVICEVLASQESPVKTARLKGIEIRERGVPQKAVVENVTEEKEGKRGKGGKAAAANRATKGRGEKRGKRASVDVDAEAEPTAKPRRRSVSESRTESTTDREDPAEAQSDQTEGMGLKASVPAPRRIYSEAEVQEAFRVHETLVCCAELASNGQNEVALRRQRGESTGVHSEIRFSLSLPASVSIRVLRLRVLGARAEVGLSSYLRQTLRLNAGRCLGAFNARRREVVLLSQSASEPLQLPEQSHFLEIEEDLASAKMMRSVVPPALLLEMARFLVADMVTRNGDYVQIGRPTLAQLIQSNVFQGFKKEGASVVLTIVPGNITPITTPAATVFEVRLGVSGEIQNWSRIVDVRKVKRGVQVYCLPGMNPGVIARNGVVSPSPSKREKMEARQPSCQDTTTTYDSSIPRSSTQTCGLSEQSREPRSSQDYKRYWSLIHCIDFEKNVPLSLVQISFAGPHPYSYPLQCLLSEAPAPSVASTHFRAEDIGARIAAIDLLTSAHVPFILEAAPSGAAPSEAAPSGSKPGEGEEEASLPRSLRTAQLRASQDAGDIADLLKLADKPIDPLLARFQVKSTQDLAQGLDDLNDAIDM